MTFASPLMLLLLAIPALMLTGIPYRGIGLHMPFDHQVHSRQRLLSWTLGAFECAPPLLLAVAIIFLAGPQSLQQPKNERLLSNIQICLDVSGSMSWEGRYEKAREAVEDFLSVREGDAFGLTLFGSHQIRWTPLTKDLNAVRNALPFADPTHQPRHMGGTMIGAALRFCRANMEVEAAQGDRMIILVSDGESSDLDDGEADVVAEELSDSGVTLYHIHVAREDVPSAVVDMARATGGEAFQAADATALAQVFRHIDRMKPAQFRRLSTVALDDFRPIAIAGLAILALHIIGLLGLRYTPW